MNRTIERFQNSKFPNYIRTHKKYLPIILFIGGFVFDSFTLGPIDKVYGLTVLCLDMICLTIALYLYNLVDDGRWKNTYLERYQVYLPLVIQFFFGGLASAYVIYFSRSVSLSKTIIFFIILLILLFANETLKRRISNKYLQFSVYFFVSFTFFTFMIPVFIKEINTLIFIFSGLVSLAVTFILIIIIYLKSPSTRVEIHIKKLTLIILIMYVTINSFYFTNLIPPVPLALDAGIVAHDVQIVDNTYLVTYESNDWYVFWRDYKLRFIIQPNERVFVFTSIFAPTEIKKSIFNRWEMYNETTKSWEIVDNISYKITGGRDNGFRGYTYKDHVKPGFWKVDVTTKEGSVLGVINFEIVVDTNLRPKSLVERRF